MEGCIVTGGGAGGEGVRMKRLLLDTNIYGLLAVDSDLHLCHQAFEQKREIWRIYGFSVIRKELKKVPRRVIDGVNIQASLLRAYSYFISKEYELEGGFETIAEQYYQAYVSLGGELPKKEIYNDLLIVACSSVKNIDLVVSEDNATLAHEFFRKVYASVNEELKLQMPVFIKYKKFKESLLGTGFPNPFVHGADKLRILLGFFYILKWVLFHMFTKKALYIKVSY